MIIPDREQFIKEVEAITSKENTREKLMQLYDHIKGYARCENPNKIVEEVLSDLFGGKFATDILIPFNFYKTDIAKIIFSIIHDSIDRLYSMKDLIEFTKTEEKLKGYTRQYLNHEIRDGRLQGIKKGKMWMFTEDQINEYLITKELKPIKKDNE